MSGSIYIIRHLPSGRCYVGSSYDIKRRWSVHRSRLKAGRHHSKPLQQAFDADGFDALEFIIIETDFSNEQSLIGREKGLIVELGEGFNVNEPCGIRWRIPTNTASISIRMEPELRNALEQAAEAEGRSLSAMVTKIAADWARANGWLKEPKR